MALVLPNDSQRITIIGKTGSGKTVAALWLLSQRSIDRRPWIIFDFKLDPTLASLPGVKEIGLASKPAALPKHPGVYIVRPKPSDIEAVEQMMWAIWERERVGLYVDEGYMIPARSHAFQAILTQGRSKRIPVIMLTQRPAWVTRFAFSEADYIQLFQLTDYRDTKIVKNFMPLPIEETLPAPYYSWWYDSPRNFKAVLQPVSDPDIILDTFKRRLTPARRSI